MESRWHVMVGVALRRPPRVEEYRHYVVWAPDGVEAEQIAREMACRGAVMPVWSALEI